MAGYEIRRTIEAVSTGSASTEGVAKTDAEAAVAGALREAGGEDLRSVEAEAVEVYEYPNGPFDPYRVTVRATVAVVVDEDGEQAALAAGGERVDAIVAAADLDDWEYVGGTELEAPA
jgi:hypothetical protein